MLSVGRLQLPPPSYETSAQRQIPRSQTPLQLYEARFINKFKFKQKSPNIESGRTFALYVRDLNFIPGSYRHKSLKHAVSVLNARQQMSVSQALEFGLKKQMSLVTVGIASLRTLIA